jgi:hypothetical protein
MDRDILDIATDMLNDEMKAIDSFISEDLKGKRPYQKKPVSKADRIAQYLTTFNTPEKKQQVIAQFGDIGANYINKMENEVRGYTNAQL